METNPKRDLNGLTHLERTTRRVCIAASGGLLAIVLALLFVEPALALSLSAFMAFNLFIGREAAMALGSTMGLAPWLMFLVNVVQSLAMGLLVYFLLIHALAKNEQGKVAKWARKIHTQAGHHRKTIDRFGPPGIFLLMVVPFMSRPYLGALAGRLAGLEHHQMMIPVVAATVVVSAVWAWSISFLIALLLEVWDGSGVLVTVLFTLATLVATLLFYRQHRKSMGKRTAGTSA